MLRVGNKVQIGKAETMETNQNQNQHTVGSLIAALEQFPPDMEVYFEDPGEGPDHFTDFLSGLQLDDEGTSLLVRVVPEEVTEDSWTNNPPM